MAKCVQSSPSSIDYEDEDNDLALHTPEPPTLTTMSTEEFVTFEEEWSQWSSFSECQGFKTFGKKTRTRRLPDFDGDGRWMEEVEVKLCSLD